MRFTPTLRRRLQGALGRTNRAMTRRAEPLSDTRHVAVVVENERDPTNGSSHDAAGGSHFAHHRGRAYREG